jgi:hypothetical protein
MHSIFGPVALQRHYYYAPATGTGRFPLDEALGLVESFSPALVRLGARAAAREGYEAASEDLLALAGIALAGRQIHRLVQQVGPSVAAALEQGPNLDPQPIPVMYIEGDATGVPMVTEALAGRKGKQTDGSAKTREVKLGCVFTQTKPEAETGLPVRDPDSTTYTGSFQTAEEFGGHLRREALRRGLDRAVQVVFLGGRGRLDLGTGARQLPAGHLDRRPLPRLGTTPRVMPGALCGAQSLGRAHGNPVESHAQE